jgi:hypothetical protein
MPRKNRQGGVAPSTDDGNGSVNLLSDHAPLIGTILVFGFVILKVYQVARLDTTTTLTLIARSSPAPLILGTFLSVLPALVISVSLWLAFGIYQVKSEETQKILMRILLLVALIAALLLPWPIAIETWAIVMVLIAALLLRKHRGKGVSPGSDLAIVVAVGIVNVLLTSAVWLPAEVVQTQQQGPLIAYVIAYDDTWTTMLRDSDRRIFIVPTDQINSRVVCDLSHSSARSVTQIILGESGARRNPKCPEHSDR